MVAECFRKLSEQEEGLPLRVEFKALLSEYTWKAKCRANVANKIYCRYVLIYAELLVICCVYSVRLNDTLFNNGINMLFIFLVLCNMGTISFEALSSEYYVWGEVLLRRACNMEHTPRGISKKSFYKHGVARYFNDEFFYNNETSLLRNETADFQQKKYSHSCL